MINYDDLIKLSVYMRVIKYIHKHLMRFPLYINEL